MRPFYVDNAINSRTLCRSEMHIRGKGARDLSELPRKLLTHQLDAEFLQPPVQFPRHPYRNLTVLLDYVCEHRKRGYGYVDALSLLSEIPLSYFYLLAR